MPCGGITAYPPGDFWSQGKCWVCDEEGCELFCEEWDTPLHYKCLGTFLASEEGQVVLRHRHMIDIPEGVYLAATPSDPAPPSPSASLDDQIP